MSDTKRKKPKANAVKKPPPRWRRYLVQAELELPPPTPGSMAAHSSSDDGREPEYREETPLAWWQTRAAVGGLVTFCVLLLVVAGMALHRARADRADALKAKASVQVLTLRASSSVRELRITPNPRSWSASPDISLKWPEPPQMLDLYLPVGYTEYLNFAVTIDKVDQGRVLVVQRMAPDSNRDLRLSLNSSAFGPGEYRIRLQGYTWRGERRDVGWVRLVVR